MKKMLFGLIATVFFGFIGNSQISPYGQKIGVVQRGGSYIITENIDNIKTLWAEYLLANNIRGILSDFEIKEDYYLDIPTEKYYILLAKSRDNSVQRASFLKLVNNTFYFSIEEVGDGRTVTCSGCTVGCSPKYYKNGKFWRCDFPCEDCVKTETVSY